MNSRDRDHTSQFKSCRVQRSYITGAGIIYNIVGIVYKKVRIISTGAGIIHNKGMDHS